MDDHPDWKKGRGELPSLSELRQQPIQRLRELHPSLPEEKLLEWVEKLEELLHDLLQLRPLWVARGQALQALRVAIDEYLAAPDIAVRPRRGLVGDFGWDEKRRETAEKLRKEVRWELEDRAAAEVRAEQLRKSEEAGADLLLAAAVLPPSGKSPWRRYFAYTCAEDGLYPVHMALLHAAAFKRFGSVEEVSPFWAEDWREEQTRKWAAALRALGIPSSELKKKRESGK